MSLSVLRIKIYFLLFTAVDKKLYLQYNEKGNFYETEMSFWNLQAITENFWKWLFSQARS